MPRGRADSVTRIVCDGASFVTAWKVRILGDGRTAASRLVQFADDQSLTTLGRCCKSTVGGKCPTQAYLGDSIVAGTPTNLAWFGCTSARGGKRCPQEHKTSKYNQMLYVAVLKIG